MENNNKKLSSLQGFDTTIDEYDSFAVNYVMEKEVSESLEQKAKIQSLYDNLKSNFEELQKECSKSDIQIHLQVASNIDKLYESDYGYELINNVKYSLVFIQKIGIK